MNETIPDFDDPNLRETVRRATGGARAAPDLRAAVESLVERETAGTTRGPGSFRPAWPRRWIAAAAVLFVLFGTGATLWQRRLRHEHEEAEYLAANLPLFKEMIRAGQAGGGAEAFDVTDRVTLRRTLSARLGRAVPVPDLSTQGWRLSTATVGPIGPHRGARLSYENAGRTLSFVSLPARAYTAETGEEPEPYAYVVDDRVVAGFVRDGGLHCFIGGAGVTKDEVARLKVD
jgi:hypothetical protein